MRSVALLLVSSAAFASPTLMWTDAGIDSRPGDMCKIDPNDGLSAAWRQGMVSYPNATLTRDNVVMTEGWNCSSQGIVDPYDGMMCDVREQHYEANGVPQMEGYTVFCPGNGQPCSRLISVQGQKGSPYRTEVGLRADIVTIGGGHNLADPAAITVTPLNTYFASPDGLMGFYVSNAVMMLYAGASRLYLTLTALLAQTNVMPSADGAYDLGTSGANVSLRKRWRQGHFKTGLSVGGALADRPVCDFEHERWIYTAEWEMGQETTTYQCCANASGVTAWKAGMC